MLENRWLRLQEVIGCILPMCSSIMTVNREYRAKRLRA
jgi:hypothetical protein